MYQVLLRSQLGSPMSIDADSYTLDDNCVHFMKHSDTPVGSVSSRSS